MIKNLLIITSIGTALLSACSKMSSAESDIADYELENKREYSIIESEYYSREKDVIDRDFITVSKFDPAYEIAIIRTRDRKYEFSIVLMNPRFPPSIKSFPVKDMEIPDDIKAKMRQPSE